MQEIHSLSIGTEVWGRKKKHVSDIKSMAEQANIYFYQNHLVLWPGASYTHFQRPMPETPGHKTDHAGIEVMGIDDRMN